MPLAFEKLQVYQKAITFADAVCTMTSSRMLSGLINGLENREPIIPAEQQLNRSV
jgi:hypothetical protein